MKKLWAGITGNAASSHPMLGKVHCMCSMSFATSHYLHVILAPHLIRPCVFATSPKVIQIQSKAVKVVKQIGEGGFSCIFEVKWHTDRLECPSDPCFIKGPAIGFAQI